MCHRIHDRALIPEKYNDRRNHQHNRYSHASTRTRDATARNTRHDCSNMLQIF